MSNYKGMREYGVSTQDIKDYADDKGLDRDVVWGMCIQAMVDNGATEYEGREGLSPDCYLDYWRDYDFLEHGKSGITSHYDVAPLPLITVKDLLGDTDKMTGKPITSELPEGIILTPDTKSHSSPIQLKLFGGEDLLEFMKSNTDVTIDPKNMKESSEEFRKLLGYKGGVLVVEISVMEV